MSFMMYDIILLIIFFIAIVVFLYVKRKNLKKEGWLFLYKTRWGIKLINYTGKKYPKTLKILSYVSITIGYLLMAGMIWLFYNILSIYFLRPDVVSQIKVPPIMPLIPYIDKVVPFLPPFYFTYWIIILAIIAITHEFAHGIFAAYNKVKIKKTGFGFFPFFLPIFLAAFVELDEKAMPKKSNTGQRAILSAGTFANVLTAILFFFVIWGFFTASFTPAGVIFDDYTYSITNISAITMINGIQTDNPSINTIKDMVKNNSFNEIEAGGRSFAGIKGFNVDEGIIALYDNAPAINSQLNGAILTINNEKITDVDKLAEELNKYKPGDKIKIETKTSEGIKVYDIELVENPDNPGSVLLGIGFIDKKGGSLSNKIFMAFSSFRNSNIYYESKIGELGEFIYNLLWWLILISISVALVNMLPVGIFDGGRFFYLTIIAITGNEKLAKNSFKWLTYIFLFLLLAIMVFWAYAVFF